MCSSTFFDLCSDVLLELFEYFALNELFEIFGELIPSLTSLLNQSHMKFHIDRNANEDFWNEILPMINSNQILAIDNSSYSISNLSAFSSIRSINLIVHSSFVFNQFEILIHLEQLAVQLSEIIFEDQIWLSQILILPRLRKLKLALNNSKPVLIPQQSISIGKSILQSATIESLEMKIPMPWSSLFCFLHHFPNLKIFRASLYRLDTSHPSRLNLPSRLILPSLRTLDLQGYMINMSSIISFISLRMSKLQHCYLIALNVTTDNAFRMKYPSIWQDLFQSCSNLTRLQIHLLMSMERNDSFDIRMVKDLLRTFNNHSFCEKYHFQMEQRSINRGYVTLTGDYQKKKEST